jgi:hypothetical protein
MNKVDMPVLSLRGLGLRAALMMIATMFFEMSVSGGSGSFWAGLPNAVMGLLIYGFGYAVMAGLACLVAMGLGRLFGTKMVYLMLIVGMVILSARSWIMSQPEAVFKRKVWREMPASITELSYQKKSSFNDGSTYVFKLKCDANTLREMCHELGLVEGGRESMQRITGEVPERMLTESAAFFGRPGLETVTSGKQVFVVSWMIEQ